MIGPHSGEWYLRLDNQRDGSHAFPIANAWKEVHSNVDAVFSYDNKLYFIKVGWGNSNRVDVVVQCVELLPHMSYVGSSLGTPVTSCSPNTFI